MEKKFIFKNIIISSKTIPENNWNELLQKSQYATYYQTKEYANYRKIIFGHIPIFLRFLNSDNKIIGQLVIYKNRFGLKYCKKIFGDGKFYSFYKNLAFPVNKIMWDYGPIIFEREYENELMYAFGRFLFSNKIKFHGNSHPLDGLKFSSEFHFNLKNSATFLIDLNDELDTILSKTDKNSVRKNIKRAEERDLKIRQIKTKDDVLTHYKLLKEHRIRNHLIYPSKNGILENYAQGKNVGITGFIAMFDENPVASITISYYNGYIVEQGISRSILDIEKKLYAQELLRWEVIKWGKQNNGRFYDFAGINPEKRTSKEEGIFRNKKKWGGNLVNYISYWK